MPVVGNNDVPALKPSLTLASSSDEDFLGSTNVDTLQYHEQTQHTSTHKSK